MLERSSVQRSNETNEIDVVKKNKWQTHEEFHFVVRVVRICRSNGGTRWDFECDRYENRMCFYTKPWTPLSLIIMVLENEKKPDSHLAMPEGRTERRKLGRGEGGGTREQPGVRRESSAKSYPIWPFHASSKSIGYTIAEKSSLASY